MALEFPVRANTSKAEQDIDELVAALRRAGTQAGMTEKEINDIAKATRKVKDDGEKNIGSLNDKMNNFVNDGVKRVGAAIVAAFAVDQVIELGKKIIDITSQFQKFEALLTNTLGSKSLARVAMADLADQAAKTNFSLRQVTEGYIKLRNNGIAPTNKEMMAFFDLTNNAGKEFDQFVEAVNDATRGEFERLKEFFISAHKDGDRVTLTFKNQTYEAENNAESIKNLLVQLGQLEGVTGSTAAISGTLSGQLSNLDDTFDQLFKTLGDQQSGPFREIISLISEAVTKLTDAVKTSRQIKQEVSDNFTKDSIEEFKKFAEGYDDLNKAREDYLKFIQPGLQKAIEDEDAAVQKLNENRATLKELLFDTFGQRSAAREEAEKELDSALALRMGYDDLAKALEAYVDGVEAENKARADAAAKKAEEEKLKRLAKEAELRKKINDQRVREANSIEAKNIPVEQAATLPLSGDVLTDGVTRGTAVEDLVPIANPQDDPQIKIFEDKERYKRDLLQDSYDFSIGLINSLADIQRNRTQQEIFELEERRDKEIENAGTNAAAKEKINREYDAKLKKLQKEQAERDKRLAVFNILLNTARGVTAALTSTPPNVPLSVFVGAAGLVQLGVANSNRFAKGVYDLQGPGTGTSDSILAWLSKGEDVVPADRNAKFGDILKPIIENDFLEYSDLKQIIDRKVPSMASTGLFIMPRVRDDGKLLEELRLTRKAIENKKEWHWNITEEGLRMTARQGEQWDTYVNKRYRG